MRPSLRAAAVAGAALTLVWALTGCGASTSDNGASSGSGASTAVVSTVNGMQHLDVQTFATLIGAPSTVVLDVRTPEEFASGHLPNARNLDVQSAGFDAGLATLDKKATFAVYCRSGHRSGQALERMKATGFTHVADLNGGIAAWSQAGRTVVIN
jgi:phage shock protein E